MSMGTGTMLAIKSAPGGIFTVSLDQGPFRKVSKERMKSKPSDRVIFLLLKNGKVPKRKKNQQEYLCALRF